MLPRLASSLNRFRVWCAVLFWGVATAVSGGIRKASSRQAQSGAMFGMDARIALIIAAILTGAGGLTIMSRLERSKVEQAELGADELQKALLKYYQQVSVNELPSNLEVLFQAGYITDPGLRKDPWGNPWYYDHFSTNVSLEGTLVNVHFAIIYSAGKDGVGNSPNLASETDYAEWAPLKDDVGRKVSTRDIETARKVEYVGRAQVIIDKLESMESSGFVEAQGLCSGAQPPAWCSDSGGKNYTQFNFYPASTADSTNGTVYYTTKVLAKPPYNSGDEIDMQQFVTDLGLPASYAKDPWGRLLNYHSNVNGRTDPPFSASICFSMSGENCFQRE